MTKVRDRAIKFARSRTFNLRCAVGLRRLARRHGTDAIGLRRLMVQRPWRWFVVVVGLQSINTDELYRLHRAWNVSFEELFEMLPQ